MVSLIANDEGSGADPFRGERAGWGDTVRRSPDPARGTATTGRLLRGRVAGLRSAKRLDLKGTPFQIRVWQALLEIPYGETRSYAEQARVVGSPDAVRAVGAANGRNPIPIVVPCHRVIGSNGKLTGFGEAFRSNAGCWISRVIRGSRYYRIWRSSHRPLRLRQNPSNSG